MQEKITLRIRDGQFYIVGEYGADAHNGPIIRHLWWPVNNAPRLSLWNMVPAQVDGQPVMLLNRGGAQEWYEIIDRSFPRLQFTLPQKGQTKATIIEEVPIPCPKVRKGTEVRWNPCPGRWEKWLKTRGWVVA